MTKKKDSISLFFIYRKYYEDGIGVTPNFPLALEYFGKAASKGYQPAAEKLNRPSADGTRRKKSKMDDQQQQQQQQDYLLRVVSDPKVKQDDDDDTPLDSRNNYTQNCRGGQTDDSNNICTIQ
jgi:TPR repeat protein